MSRIILLDTNVLSILTGSRPNPACRLWIDQWAATPGTVVYIPAISDYEARRGLEQLKARKQLRRLNELQSRVSLLPITDAAWRRTAVFWGQVRRAGQPTAPEVALDGDTILAGMAATVGEAGDTVIVATANIRHLSRFGVVAMEWSAIV